MGDGFDELFENDEHDIEISSVPVINTLHSMHDSYEETVNMDEVPIFYTQEEHEEMLREAELH